MNRSQFFSLLAVVAVISGSITGCSKEKENSMDSNSNLAAENINPEQVPQAELSPEEQQKMIATMKMCDDVRLTLRESTLKEFLIPETIEKLKLVSAQISPEDAKTLTNLGTVKPAGLSDAHQQSANNRISRIYRYAMEKISFEKLVQEEPIENRSFSVSFWRGHLQIDGKRAGTVLASSNATIERLKHTQEVGDLIMIEIGVTGDQSQYLIQPRQITKLEKRKLTEEEIDAEIAKGNTDADSSLVKIEAPEFRVVSFFDYIEGLLPERCEGSKTELSRDEFESIPGPGIQNSNEG